MDARIKPLVLAVLYAVAEMRHGRQHFKIFSTDRNGVEVKA